MNFDVVCAPLWRQRPFPEVEWTEVGPSPSVDVWERVSVGGVPLELRVWDWTHPSRPPWWCLLVPEAKAAMSARLGAEDSLWPSKRRWWRQRDRVLAAAATMFAGMGARTIEGWHTGRGWKATVVMVPATDVTADVLRHTPQPDGHAGVTPQWWAMADRDAVGHFAMERKVSLAMTGRLFPELALSDAGERSVFAALDAGRYVGLAG